MMRYGKSFERKKMSRRFLLKFIFKREKKKETNNDKAKNLLTFRNKGR